jgi:hypothetical protein
MLQILQAECGLIGNLKLYEPTRKSREFTTRAIRYALRPDCEPSFGGQHHIHQSCIASDAKISANGFSYHGGSGGSSLPGGDYSPCSVALFEKPAVWKTVQQIKDGYLGYLDGPEDFITVKAFISFINTERLCSAACPLAVNDKPCNVKATGNGDGTWHCELCRKSYDSCDYGIWYCKRCEHSFDSCDYVYSVRIQIQDHTSTTSATLCEEAVKEIFGCTAKDLYLMEGKEHDYNQLHDIIQVVACQSYVLQLKVEVKPWRPVECVVLKAEKVNPPAESRRLLGAINAHLWEGLDPCWEFGSSMCTYSDLPGFMGRSTARSSNKSRATSPSSADRYGCSDIDGQRSSALDGFMGRFHGALPTAVNFAPNVRSIHSPRTSAHRAERSPKKP